ncbi:dihydrofolate reductase family protein [Micromonospora avicenniae]|uniref:Dihydrofolate reductase n=1 Tax=Micromonospora avicenniae TaxID=1198245 RepID=A0A1N7B196_9ACTN|nr:dihydrofolate reductase family protein [Micromonospora avicenniae]SIR45139.1 Dihydrofolate reductase [Micromonospora avicenniae]
MRRIVVHMSVSLDGYFEGPGGDLSWHRVDDELHEHFNAELRTMGAFLNGRIAYELMAAYWPTADQDPASPPAVREYAGIWREMPKIVYSRTLERADWNATVVREVDPDEVRRLKAEPGGDLALGGADLMATFMRHDLVDEWRTYVHPVLLGRGRPLFPAGVGPTDLRLVESRVFGNGVVLLRHRR